MDIATILVLAGIALGVFVALYLTVWVITKRRVVPTNMTHIVQRKKTTTLYGQGQTAGNVYYHWPKWMPIIGIDVSIFQGSIFDVTLKDYEAYDAGRLPFVVDVKAFFRVDDADVAAKRVSTFEELKTQLTAVLQGSVRRILATNDLETIMQDRSKLGGEFTTEVDEQLKEWGVKTVKSIEFMDIRDSGGSNVIDNIMAKEKSRIDRESRVAVAENNRAAEEKEIEARRQVELQRQDAEQQVGIRTAMKEQVVGQAEEQSKQEILTQAKVTTERDMDVKKVQEVRAADIAKDVAVVRANQEKEVQIVAANAAKEQTVISANAKKTETETVAAGNLTAAKLSAEGTLATGTAEAESRKLMELAPVQAQIVLAQEIGDNEGYQTYLQTIRQIEASQAVGIELAGAMAKADLKVIANAGDPQSGVAKLGDLFTTGGGTGLTGMLTALSQTPEGAALVERFTGKKGPALNADDIAEAVIEKASAKRPTK